MKKVALGKVVKLHGIRGEMKVSTKFDNDFNIKNIKKVYNENEDEFEVSRVFKVNDGIVFGLANIDLESSRKFIGKMLYIDRELVENKILFEDLKGSDVYADEKLIGKIVDVGDYGSAEVIFVKKIDGKELIFPNVKGIIKSFSIDEKKLCLERSKLCEVCDYED